MHNEEELNEVLILVIFRIFVLLCNFFVIPLRDDANNKNLPVQDFIRNYERKDIDTDFVNIEVDYYFNPMIGHPELVSY